MRVGGLRDEGREDVVDGDQISSPRWFVHRKEWLRDEKVFNGAQQVLVFPWCDDGRTRWSESTVENRADALRSKAVGKASPCIKTQNLKRQ